MSDDPKMQGIPPPYTQNPPPVGVQYAVQPHLVHTTGATVIHARPAVVPVLVGQHMGPKPQTMTCKSCRHEIVTKVEMKATMRTHLFAALLCLFGCWPCVCIPYCMDSCNNANHYCPNCNAYIGSYIN